MPAFAGPLSEARIREAGAHWYAELLRQAAAPGVAAAQRLVATGRVPDMHHITLRQSFPPGTVPADGHAEPRVAVDLPVLDYGQEAIDRHPDGSLKDAAFTLLLPAMAEGDEVIIEFRARHAPPPREAVALWPQYGADAVPAVTATALAGYAEPDETAAVAAELAPGEWRRIERNRYRDIVHPGDGGGLDPYYWYPGKTDNPVNDTNGLPFAYSSGAFLPARRKYVFTGGGHADWLGSEIGVFDYRTRRWHRTEDSARYVVGNTGVGEPMEEELFDPTAPVRAHPHGSRYHYPWPNIRGRHAPLSTHTYCGVEHAAERGRIYVYGAAGFPGGSAKPGGIWVIDDTDFRWRGAETIPTESNGYNSWTRYLGDGRLFCFTGQRGETRIFDVGSKRELSVGGEGGVRPTYGSASAAVFATGEGDGGRAFVTWAAGEEPRLVVAGDLDGGGAGAFSVVDGGVPLPKGVDRQASWLYLGDFLPGSRTIAVYQPGVGLYGLDTRTWRWTGPHDTGEGADGRPPEKRAWKGFGYLPDYDCFSVVHIGSVWICKRPPELA